MRSQAWRLSLILFLAVIAAAIFTGCAAEKGRKVMIIGLDGFSYDLAAPLMDAGALPNLARIAREGAFGELASSIPPTAPAAWTTAVTGTNPGKHGIFGNSKGFTFENGTFVSHYFSALDRKVAAVWNLLSDAGRTSIVIGVPLTSPPDTLKGIMVAGGPHTNTENFTYPAELASLFPGDYTLAYSGGDRKSQEYLDYLQGIHEKEKLAALELLEREPWDFFIAVFTMPDRVQRYYWQFMDAKHPLHAEGASRFADVIPEAYRRMDQLVGEFESKAHAAGADFLVVSAYGFAPVYTTLNAENLINRNWPPEGRDIFIVNWDRIGGVFGITFTKPPEVTKENWEKYSQLAGELHGVLTSLKDPSSGEPAIDTLYHRANIYTGPAAASAPDVIAVEKKGYLFVNWARTEGGEIFSAPTEEMPGAVPRGNGVLFATGPDIARGKRIEGGRIMDLAPTILYLAGATIPKYMDGQVLEDMIGREYLDGNPVETKMVEAPLGTKKGLRIISDEEEAVLREQMKSMEAGR
jgi:predicted AlkP superfamily phosphohydrolase/phosphomutase